MSRWERLGLLPLDTSPAPWAATHAALPIVEAVDRDAWRVYVSVRDDQGRARIGRAPLAMEPRPMLGPIERDPVLDLGALGAFDDSGVTSSSLVVSGTRRLLFYTGWSRGVTVPFYLASGVAVSDGDGAFHRVSAAPLLDRSGADPYLNASPFVLAEPDRWRMWYVSGTSWTATACGPRHHYNVRYAESPDGLAWTRSGRVCLDYASDAEHAFARTCVIRDGSAYRMWYAVRGVRYEVGYAESADGIEWRRLDATGGLKPSAEGWDSEMVEYPYVFEWRGTRFMLYNGNGYGRTGVGLARWA